MQLNQPEVLVVPIDQLKPWAKNPRKGHAVKAIARSIESFGYLSPIIVQKSTMRVLAGHGRLQALRKANVSEVPVLLADLDDDKAAAFTVADNKLHDTSKFDLGDLGSLMGNMSAEMALLTGFGDDELAKLAALQDELADVGNVAINARKGTLYAGDDNSALKAAMNDRTLVIVFESEAQLATVRGLLRKLQAGNEKSTGQVVLEVFSAHKMPEPTIGHADEAKAVSKSQSKRLAAQSAEHESR